MRISDYVCSECLIADLAAQDIEGVLEALAKAAEEAGLNGQRVLAVLRDREKLGSTAVGDGVAIPHGKVPGLEKIHLFFARSLSGVDCNAPDGKKCRFFFAVLAPEGAAGQHLGLLGAIARLAKDRSFTAQLDQAKNTAELASFLASV